VDLHNLQENWDKLGSDDPLWAILAAPEQRGNKWDREEFLATGRAHVDEILTSLEEADIAVQFGRALDFGCGVGRLTQALGRHFLEADGVDIAPSMIDLAEEMNLHPDRIRFHLNAADELSLFDDDSFDFVLSLIVLQHIENHYKASYLREFVRVLKPGGIAVFTVPSHATWSPKGLIYRLVPNHLLNLYRKRRYGYAGVMELHGMRRTDVEAALVSAGAEVLHVEPEPLLGTDWNSFRYTVRANA